MIEEIKRLSPELSFQSFPDYIEILEQREIEVHDLGDPQRVAAKVADCSKRRERQAAQVDVVARVAGDRIAAAGSLDQVGPFAARRAAADGAGPGASLIVGDRKRERSAALGLENPADLPSPKQRF